MSLTDTDKKEMREMMVDTVSSALEDIVVPRLDKLEGRMDSIEGRMDGIEGRMDGQERATDELRSELRTSVASLHTRIDEVEANLLGKIGAIENDVKEIYMMIADLQTLSPTEKKFAKLSLEQKILKTHAQIIAMAKQAGIKLPT